MNRKLIIVILFPLILTSIWFGSKKMLAHAEEGIPFYDSARTLKQYSSIWQEYGMGEVIPFVIPRTTLYVFTAFLQGISLSAIQIQQLIFFLIILVPIIFTPLLVKRVIPASNESTILFASIFYVFNLYVLSQVLQRFLYELIFLWSYFPLFLYLWASWLKTKEIKYLIFFLATSVLYSNIFVLVASLFALWIPAGILWLSERKIIRGLIAGILWLAVSSWWLYPLTSIKNSPYAQQLNTSLNTSSLIDVSKFFPTSEILLLKQSYFFGPNSAWYNYFSSGPLILISYIVLFLVVIGIFSLIKQKIGKVLFVWFLLAWFLVKGANPPFGVEFYTWLFHTFPFTSVLRNPYEKLGVVFLMPYSIFAAVGLSKIPFRYVKIGVIFLVCFVLLRPMWTKQVFMGYEVDIPPTYKQANQYVNSQSNLRLLQFPYLHGAGTSYAWGYSGDELSNFLFDRPSVSKTYYSPNDPYLLLHRHLRSPNIHKLLQLFAIDTVVLHKDTLPGPAYQENYEGAKSMLETMRYMHLDKSFNNLETYRLDDDIPVEWGYLSNRVVKVESLSEGLDMVLKSESFITNSDTFTTSNTVPDITLNKLPKFSITKVSSIRYRIHIQEAEFPYILVLSTSYHPSWQARIGSEKLVNHFQINGYANGWYVDKSGNYIIDILFKTWPWE